MTIAHVQRSFARPSPALASTVALRDGRQLEWEALRTLAEDLDLVRSGRVSSECFGGYGAQLVYDVLVHLARTGEPSTTRADLEVAIGSERLPHADGDIAGMYLYQARSASVPELLRAAELRAARARKDSAIVALGHELELGAPIDEAEREYQAARDRVRELEEAARPSPLELLFQPLGAHGYLSAQPPPRSWLLRRPDPQTNGATTMGVLARGKVGLLVAQGGAGKTMALMGLALAVATGRRWLDTFETGRPGRVLLALGEESPDEIHRRMFDAARAMRLTPAQEQLAGENIVALPLHGLHVSLLEGESSAAAESRFARELRAKLDAGGDWALVALDPLSRFAAGDSEKDNAAATRFIEVAEGFTSVPGNPTVLVAHHTNKASRIAGGKSDTADTRGASGLTDGARWVARLESAGDETATLRVTKSNYGASGPEVRLVRDRAHGGFLRLATPDEWRELRERGEQEDREEQEDLACRVLAFLATNPGAAKGAIRTGVGGRERAVSAAVDALGRSGRIVRSGRYGWALPAADATA